MARDQYERIQQRAYEIWENEGRPEGAAARHWDQAQDEIAGDDEHETLRDLIDEDDIKDEERAESASLEPASENPERR
ncbi:DUF2934 domain-containing protein [Rhizobium sp. XQZ8]|uniref:DUF2934 domain-containing protein n=1 Tax=Rhizobium populisoli TaxID=2859785 RepID=UPI001C66ABB3|nr:DUF2934 domain-containing protein [Rhizobium populisoli]